VLGDRVSAQGYEECQGDILAVSGMAEDIRDALLEYQVGSKRTHAVILTEIATFQQTTQQRAIYDQNCRLIVSR